MDHKYLEKLAKLYESENADTPEGSETINKLETRAVAHYITDVANAVGLHRGMDDLPIIAAALRVQSDFIINNLNEDRQKYVEHLEKLMRNMSVCSIEVDVAELIKQIRELKNEMKSGSELPDTDKEDKDTDGENS